MSYGSNGGVIGPENAPTTSAASGVWSLGELAEAERDSLWPAPAVDFEAIARFVADGSTATYDFTSIPQDYRDLRLVASLGRNAVSGEKLFIYVDVGSGFDTSASNYGTYGMRGGSGNYGSMQTENNTSQAGYNYDWPGSPTTARANSFIMDWSDYADATKLPNAIFWQNNYMPGGSSATTITGAWQRYVAGAISGIRITRNTTTSNYYFKQPTTFTLFGRGAAD
jgi:hypothetical protein